jgi:hypothetical protein
MFERVPDPNQTIDVRLDDNGRVSMNTFTFSVIAGAMAGATLSRDSSTEAVELIGRLTPELSKVLAEVISTVFPAN